MGLKEPWEKMSKSSDKDFNRINMLDDSFEIDRKIKMAYIENE